MDNFFALTRAVGRELADCELSFVDREPLDIEKADEQHAAYESVLGELGIEVVSLPADPKYPDGVFVEDAAVVFNEVAVISRPGAKTRRGEVESVARVLAPHRRLEHIFEPGTLDGGDVMRIGKDVYVGVSDRTNEEAIIQLTAILDPFLYRVHSLKMQNCLHLKTGVTYLGWNHILTNPDWIDLSPFSNLDVIHVDPLEPFAANSLAIKQTILYPTCFPKTQARIQEKGFTVRTLDISELQKAEAGLTCLSIIWKNF